MSSGPDWTGPKPNSSGGCQNKPELTMNIRSYCGNPFAKLPNLLIINSKAKPFESLLGGYNQKTLRGIYVRGRGYGLLKNDYEQIEIHFDYLPILMTGGRAAMRCEVARRIIDNLHVWK